MFEVVVTNEILGNSRQIMSMAQLETYNKCALLCAKKAALDGKAHTCGMWTVSPVKNTEQQVQPERRNNLEPLAAIRFIDWL